MTAVSTRTHQRRNPIVAGIVLITIGAIAWAMNATGTDPSTWLGGCRLRWRQLGQVSSTGGLRGDGLRAPDKAARVPRQGSLTAF